MSRKCVNLACNEGIPLLKIPIKGLSYEETIIDPTSCHSITPSM